MPTPPHLTPCPHLIPRPAHTSRQVIEPLESVSVSFIPTEKKDVSEFGDAKEVRGWGDGQEVG